VACLEGGEFLCISGRILFEQVEKHQQSVENVKTTASRKHCHLRMGRELEASSRF